MLETETQKTFVQEAQNNDVIILWAIANHLIIMGALLVLKLLKNEEGGNCANSAECAEGQLCLKISAVMLIV